MCETLDGLKKQLIDIEKATCIENEKTVFNNEETINFCDLPDELIIKISLYLDPEFIRYTLCQVCQRFDSILNDIALWRKYVKDRVPTKFPALPSLKYWEDKDVDWEGCAVEMCREYKKWVDVQNTMRHVVVQGVHIASVDTILLINDGLTCISGGRDRGMMLWKVLDIGPHDRSDNTTSLDGCKPRHMRVNAHDGWVWDLAADDVENAKTVYSASWDNTVKAWDLETGLTCVSEYPCGMSALSVICKDNILCTGLYNKRVLQFDVRAGVTPVTSYKPHRGPVLALEAFDKYVASVSEDRTLAVWDRVAGKLIKTGVNMPIKQSYPVCISWSPAALYVGDSRGSLHLINPEKLKYEDSVELWDPNTMHFRKVTGCLQTPACMIVCSDKGELKFLYNGFPPVCYTTIQATTYDITQLRYQNDVMAIGTCDSAIEFWVPVERYSDLAL